MDKAEQRALEEYPPQTIHFTNRYPKRVQSFKVDAHAPARKIYIKGYHQAQEDSKLTKEDISKIHDLILTSAFKNTIVDYEEVANKFNNSRINN